ncbi:hypothetical protein BD626DRAFT_187204 [Schizophyllum amplum]|uniref:Uncharacterized protein n=1 Tax=Schizophyllum amplum TaxID=97359 RepID=A0A550C0K6_9AGAR|nr:hypothetical protein BD626DRAFT_187204 [Auriculariopsis ampla]
MLAVPGCELPPRSPTLHDYSLFFPFVTSVSQALAFVLLYTYAPSARPSGYVRFIHYPLSSIAGRHYVARSRLIYISLTYLLGSASRVVSLRT